MVDNVYLPSGEGPQPDQVVAAIDQLWSGDVPNEIDGTAIVLARIFYEATTAGSGRAGAQTVVVTDLLESLVRVCGESRPGLVAMVDWLIDGVGEPPWDVVGADPVAMPLYGAVTAANFGPSRQEDLLDQLASRFQPLNQGGLGRAEIRLLLVLGVAGRTVSTWDPVAAEVSETAAILREATRLPGNLVDPEEVEFALMLLEDGELGDAQAEARRIQALIERYDHLAGQIDELEALLAETTTEHGDAVAMDLAEAAELVRRAEELIDERGAKGLDGAEIRLQMAYERCRSSPPLIDPSELPLEPDADRLLRSLPDDGDLALNIVEAAVAEQNCSPLTALLGYIREANQESSILEQFRLIVPAAVVPELAVQVPFDVRHGLAPELAASDRFQVVLDGTPAQVLELLREMTDEDLSVEDYVAAAIGLVRLGHPEAAGRVLRQVQLFPRREIEDFPLAALELCISSARHEDPVRYVGPQRTAEEIKQELSTGEPAAALRMLADWAGEHGVADPLMLHAFAVFRGRRDGESAKRLYSALCDLDERGWRFHLEYARIALEVGDESSGQEALRAAADGGAPESWLESVRPAAQLATDVESVDGLLEALELGNIDVTKAAESLQALSWEDTQPETIHRLADHSFLPGRLALVSRVAASWGQLDPVEAARLFDQAEQLLARSHPQGLPRLLQHRFEQFGDERYAMPAVDPAALPTQVLDIERLEEVSRAAIVPEIKLTRVREKIVAPAIRAMERSDWVAAADAWQANLSAAPVGGTVAIGCLLRGRRPEEALQVYQQLQNRGRTPTSSIATNVTLALWAVGADEAALAGVRYLERIRPGAGTELQQLFERSVRGSDPEQHMPLMWPPTAVAVRRRNGPLVEVLVTSEITEPLTVAAHGCEPVLVRPGLTAVLSTAAEVVEINAADRPPVTVAVEEREPPDGYRFRDRNHTRGTPFAGRDSFLDALVRFLDTPHPGYLLAFHGSSGIGKSALLVEGIERTGRPPEFVVLEDGRRAIDALVAAAGECSRGGSLVIDEWQRILPLGADSLRDTVGRALCDLVDRGGQLVLASNGLYSDTKRFLDDLGVPIQPYERVLSTLLDQDIEEVLHEGLGSEVVFADKALAQAVELVGGQPADVQRLGRLLEIVLSEEGRLIIDTEIVETAAVRVAEDWLSDSQDRREDALTWAWLLADDARFDQIDVAADDFSAMLQAFATGAARLVSLSPGVEGDEVSAPNLRFRNGMSRLIVQRVTDRYRYDATDVSALREANFIPFGGQGTRSGRQTMCPVWRDRFPAMAYLIDDADHVGELGHFDRFEGVVKRQFTADAPGVPTYLESVRPWVITKWVPGINLRRWQKSWIDQRQPRVSAVLDSFIQWAEILRDHAAMSVHHGRLTDRSLLLVDRPGGIHHVVGWKLVESTTPEQQHAMERSDCLSLLDLLMSTLEVLAVGDPTSIDDVRDLRFLREHDELRFVDVIGRLRLRRDWLEGSSRQLIVDLTAVSASFAGVTWDLDLDPLAEYREKLSRMSVEPLSWQEIRDVGEALRKVVPALVNEIDNRRNQASDPIDIVFRAHGDPTVLSRLMPEWLMINTHGGLWVAATPELRVFREGGFARDHWPQDGRLPGYHVVTPPGSLGRILGAAVKQAINQPWATETFEPDPLQALAELPEGRNVLHLAAHGKSAEPGGADTSLLWQWDPTADARRLRLGEITFPRNVDVLVVTACSLGDIPDDTLGSLIDTAFEQKIRAVVAAQHPVTFNAVEKFSAAFAGSLARGEKISNAVTAGRIALREGTDHTEHGAFTLTLRNREDDWLWPELAQA